MRFAYADPPYIGQGSRYEHDKEVNHGLLVDWLCRDFDAWALSCSTPTLKTILNLCPDDVRVCAWVKPFCAFKVNVNPAYAWEPGIAWHPRKKQRYEPTVRDWVAEGITLKRGFCGAKPERFCFWLFDLLGMTPDDEFVDVFPGSGAVSRAWDIWRADNTRLLEVPA